MNLSLVKYCCTENHSKPPKEQETIDSATYQANIINLIVMIAFKKCFTRTMNNKGLCFALTRYA